GLLDQQRECGGTADERQLIGAAQLFGQREQIDGLAAVEEPKHRFVHRAMRVGVEVVRPQLLDDLGQRLATFEENRAEHGAFSVQIVRRDPRGKVDHVATTLSEAADGQKNFLASEKRYGGT